MRIKQYLSLAIKGKCSAYSVVERRVPELTSVLGSQPAGDASHELIPERIIAGVRASDGQLYVCMFAS